MLASSGLHWLVDLVVEVILREHVEVALSDEEHVRWVRGDSLSVKIEEAGDGGHVVSADAKVVEVPVDPGEGAALKVNP